MALPDRHPVAGTARFRTTRWSIVIAAGGDSSQASAAALARLCEAYWRPVFAFVRRRGHSVEDPSDLTQEFFARMLDGG
jgi:hypothetical protein